MPKIRIDQITIPSRRRQTFSESQMEELTNSIKETGLIQPIVLERMTDGSHKLLVGERRIRAHLRLGLEEIEYVWKEDLNDWDRKRIELDENLHREKLTWQEEVALQEDIHNLYLQKFGKATFSIQSPENRGWRISDTAETLGESRSNVTMNLQLAKAMKSNPSLAKKETKEAAYKAMKVGTELELMKGIADILAGVAEEEGESPIQLLNGDSTIILKQFKDESFDFCVTDPPFGIGMHDLQQDFPNRGEVRQGIEFDDSKDILLTVVKPVMAEVYRLLKPGSHCYVFFAIARYTEVLALLEKVGFWVCHTPLFWIKNNALNLKPHILYPVNYEPLFYCSKGYPPRPLPEIQQRSTFDYPIVGGSTKRHPAQKPLDLIKGLIENCSQPKERGVDPFLGGGTFTLACQSMDRRAVGVEKDTLWYMRSKLVLEGKEEEDGS